jgi:hypothetical protein
MPHLFIRLQQCRAKDSLSRSNKMLRFLRDGLDALMFCSETRVARIAEVYGRV